MDAFTMNRIFKYRLEVADEQEIELPSGARILTVQTQQGTPCLWAIVDDEDVASKRRIRVVGTGHPIRNISNLSYVGTFQLMSGNLVFHVFEVRT